METRYTHYDIDFELWDKGLRLDTEKISVAELLAIDLDLEDIVVLHPEWFIDMVAEEEAYRKENEPKIKAYFEEHFEGKTWAEIDGELWEFYYDWHKDVFGYRPHGIICGEYISPYTMN